MGSISCYHKNSNKAQSSLHVTQLDEKLDLEKMVGPRSVMRAVEEHQGGRFSLNSPFLTSLIFKILVCGKINSRNFTQMDGYLLLSFIQSLPKTAWGQMILLWPKRSLTWLQRDEREGSDGKKNLESCLGVVLDGRRR